MKSLSKGEYCFSLHRGQKTSCSAFKIPSTLLAVFTILFVIFYFGYRDTGNNWKEIFIHPKHAFGVLLQIAEFRPNDWIAPSNKMPEGQKWAFSKKRENFYLTFAHPGGGKVLFNMDKEEVKELIHDLKRLVE